MSIAVVSDVNTTNSSHGRVRTPAIGLIQVRRAPKKNFPIIIAETKFVAIFAIVLCCVTTLPYVVGHLRIVQGTSFTRVLEHSLDSHSYLAYLSQSASG